MTQDATVWTLKEIDVALDCRKGSAFIAFMQVKETLAENSDYRYLNPADNQSEIESLRFNQRIYSGTVNAILLSDTAYAAIRAQVEATR